MKLLLIFGLLYLHAHAETDAEVQAGYIKDVEKLNADKVLDNEFEQSLLGITVIQINLNKEISNAEVQLNNYRSQLDQILGVVKTNDVEKFQNLIAEAKSKLIEWSLKAKQANVDVSKCLTDAESNLSNILQTFMKNDFDCFDEEYKFELGKIDETQTDVNMIVNTFKAFNVEALLKTCQASKSLPCMNDLNKEITKLSKSLPEEISRKLHELMPLMNATPNRFAVCSMKFLDAMPNEVGKVTDGVATCAQPLIGQ